MNILKLLFIHEWKNLYRNKLQIIVLALFGMAALYSIHYGTAQISKQQNTIHSIQKQQQSLIKKYVEGLNADTLSTEGKDAYYKASYPSMVRFNLNYFAFNAPQALANLSIGQRDIHPFYLELNAQSLYIQLFRNELSNPQKLLAGNFDLAFVFIYLLPLLIIALSFNALSAEKEQGTYVVLRSSPVSISTIVVYKLLFQFTLVGILTIALSILGFWASPQINQVNLLSIQVFWIIVILAYALLWFALAFFINSFNRLSPFNAMALLGSWIMFLIIVPSLLNLLIANKQTISATQLSDAIRRKSLGDNEQAMNKALNSFYQYYPEYRSPDTTNKTYFKYKGYSAFLALSDRATKPLVDRYYKSIQEREKQINRFMLIDPATNTQYLLNTLAGTGFNDAFNYVQSIESFHQEIFEFCNIPLFNDRLMTAKDYLQMPRFERLPIPAPDNIVYRGFACLLLLSLLFVIAGALKLAQH